MKYTKVILSGIWVFLLFNTDVLIAQTKVSPKNRHQGIYFPPGYTPPASRMASILNWNMENFVDGFDDPYIQNDREDNPPAEMRQKEALLIKVIKEQKPDIVVFQEFETAKYLRALALEHWAEIGYPFFAEAPSINWFQNVVVMSRFPLGEMRAYGSIYTNVAGSVTRDNLPETQNLVNNRMWSIEVFPDPTFHFTLTAVHLKAGRTERDIAMRTGQIDFLKGQLRRKAKEDKELRYIIMGDFNLTPDSEEYSFLTRDKKNLKLYDMVGGPEILTHPVSSPTRRLDHTFVNRNMKPHVDKVEVKTDLMRKEELELMSDHLPIWIRLKW